MKILDIPQSGKRGLNVSLGGRYGQVSRTLAIPTNPRTAKQKNVRANFASVSENWRKLTEAQRKAWIAAALTIQTRTRLGQSGPMTGSQLFLKVNALNLDLGQPIVTDPPLRPSFEASPVTALTVTNPSGVGTLKLTVGTLNAGAACYVRASKPISQGRSVCSDFRLIGALPTATQGVSDITALYSAEFGNPPAGSKVFVQVFQTTDGYEDLPVEFSGVVPAQA